MQSIRHTEASRPALGIAIAIAILAGWSTSLILLLSAPLGAWAWAWAPIGIAVQSFLFTGLFITAHDAMHGTVAPSSPRTNAVIGRVATALYASFSYDALLLAHHRHHAHPGRAEDPDFHGGEGRGVWRWYWGFMCEYVNVRQLAIQGLTFWLLVGAGFAMSNVALFWALPALLSTTQLFFVGTYLPHRPRSEAFVDDHRARSVDLPTWLSLLACYHFGYHLEHHHHPHVPWWRLPACRSASTGRSR